MKNSIETGMVLALLLVPGVAHAESAVPACWYTGAEATPPAGPIPTNVPLITLGISGAIVEWSEITMTRVSDGYVVPLRFWEQQRWNLQPAFTPMEPLEVGATYVVRHPSCWGMPPRSTSYDVIAPIAAPATLGTVSVTGPFVSTFGQHGACHTQVFYAVTLTRDPGFDLEPWSTFEWGYALENDAASWAAIPISRATTPLYVRCGTSGVGAAPGAHRIHAVAAPSVTVNATWTPFATPEVDVTFSCDAPTWVDETTLAPLSANEISSSLADPTGTCGMDGGAFLAIDAGTFPLRDGGTGAADGAAYTEPGTNPNCGCAVGPRDAPPGVAWLAIAIAVAAKRTASRLRRSVRAT